MTQPSLPKPVFVKRKPSTKRRRRTEIPSPPHSPANQRQPSPSRAPQLSQPPQSQQAPCVQPSKAPLRPRGRVMRAQHLSITPAQSEQPTRDYSAQSLQRLQQAQTIRPPPASTTAKQTPAVPRVPEPEASVSVPPAKPSRTPHEAQDAANSRPAPFTPAWNPIARSDELAVEDQPDLSFLPTQEGSNSSDDGWEASQLARGGGRVQEQDLTPIIRRTEETPPTKGNVAALQRALIQARKEWEARDLTAGESSQRAAKAVEDAEELIRDAENVIRDREAVVSAYEYVLRVFRRASELLTKGKEAFRRYRVNLLERLESEAQEVRVRLLGGEDEFGRSVPGRLVEVDDDVDEKIALDGVGKQNEDLGFDALEVMDEVIEALRKWKTTDADGYAKGFGAQGGGGVIGRLGLALPNTGWLEKKLDKETREAALKTGEVAKLVGAEIRARWEPRRKNGFREWGKIFDDVKEDVVEGIMERFELEVDACVRYADKGEAERCARGCLEMSRLGIDAGIENCLRRLRDVLGEEFCKELDEGVSQSAAFQDG